MTEQRIVKMDRQDEGALEGLEKEPSKGLDREKDVKKNRQYAYKQ